MTKEEMTKEIFAQSKLAERANAHQLEVAFDRFMKQPKEWIERAYNVVKDNKEITVSHATFAIAVGSGILFK